MSNKRVLNQYLCELILDGVFSPLAQLKNVNISSIQAALFYVNSVKLSLPKNRYSEAILFEFPFTSSLRWYPFLNSLSATYSAGFKRYKISTSKIYHTAC